MPFIQAKLTVSIDNKDELQNKLSSLVSQCFAKPSTYIMSEIQDNCDLWMGNNKLEGGAYISISLLGSTTKQACNVLSQKICEVLKYRWKKCIYDISSR